MRAGWWTVALCAALWAPAWAAAAPSPALATRAAPLPLPATLVGDAETTWLDADDPATGQSMRALAVLPPGAPRADWRLLVLLHGLGGSARSWLEATDVVPQLVAMMRAGTIPATLILLPDGGDGYWSDWHDGAHPYGSLVGRLCERAAARYPVTAARGAHAIVGASMGGFGALSIGLRDPQRYGLLVGLSATDLAIASEDAPRRKVYRDVLGSPASAAQLRAINPNDLVRAGRGKGQRILLAWGSKEARKFREGGERLVASMRRKRLRFSHRVVRGGRHGWASTWAPLHGWWLSALRAHFGAPAAAARP